MTLLPIVARELRVASRRVSTYWVRTGAALSVIVIGTWFFLMMHTEAAKEVPLVLFGILTGFAVLYCLLSGVRSTADCLSEEKREGTLGLLFLTDLKGYDVVFGKLVATSLGAFYGVLAVVPVLAVPLLMGGITLGEFGRMALVAVNTLFFSLGLGMCISSMSRSPRKAMGLTFLVLLFVTALLPALGAWMAFLAKSNRVQPLFLILSAGRSYFLAWDVVYKGHGDEFWHSVLAIHGLAWLFLILASLIAPRSWQDRPAGAQMVLWRERWRLWSYGNAAERAAFRKRLLDANAFFWLAARARLKPASVWTVLGLIACCWAWGIAKFHKDWFIPATYVMTGLLLNLLIKGWFSSEVGRQLAEDRRTGALELLLSTPLTIREILRGQLLALLRQFLGPLVMTLVAGCLFLWASLRENDMGEERGMVVALWIGGMVMLIADLAALYWVGMWQGLTAKNPNRAASASVARIMVLPVIAFALVMLLVFLGTIRRGGHEPTWKFVLSWWFGLGLAADFVFGLWARNKLLTEFRLAAAQRYTSRLRFWRRVAVEGEQRNPGPPPVIALQK